MPSRLPRLLLTALSLATLPALGACGGGSGGGSGGFGQPPTETVVVQADDDRTGTLAQAPTGAVLGPTDFAQVGQLALISGTGAASDREFRAILTFARPNIPVGATVVRAVLTCQNILAGGGWVAGTSNNIGNIVADHFDVGSTLDLVDFDSAALDTAFAVFLQPGQLNGAAGDVVTLDVTAQVQADISNGRDQTGIRLLAPNAIVGGAGPHQLFVDGSDPAQFPTLTIEFRR